MTPERLRQIEDLYHAAVERRDDEREAFLRAACAGDDELRTEVEALLAQNGGISSLLETPALAAFAVTATVGSLVGTQLGGYRVTELLGVGGMGEVYRATDTRLQRDVAIKVLPAALSVFPERLRRFEQEARLLAALNHQNIGAIYGLEEADGVRGLVLELVEGPTLADRLAEGPIPVADALSIGRQIAEALATAHEKGIVHRDLKPSNIKLTPQGLVKVLDFGIAKSRVSEAVTPETREGMLLGTAAYMSPEQARGQPVDARTDLWAFGCVLYEMLSGRVPFPGNTTVDTIASILDREPDWSALPPGVPSSLERLMRRCLEKDRDQRVKDIQEVRQELDQAFTDSARAFAWGPRSLRGRFSAAIAGVVVLAVVAGLWISQVRGLRRPAAPVAAASIKARRAIAVMGFKNLSGRSDAAWLSPALSETLTMELATGGALRAIPGESVARMKIDLAFADADSFAQDTLGRIRRNIGADLLVLGSYLAVGKEGDARIRLDLRLQDASSGDLVATLTETGAESELLELVSRAGVRLRESLGLGELSDEESALAKATMPSSQEAARLYAEGVDKLRLFDALEARDLLEKAVTVDPDYALAHAALASAWSALGYDVRATGEAKKAFDLSQKLSREQRLAIEGGYREMTHEWGKAAEIYKALSTVFPDHLEYGLRLAEAESAGGHGKEALAVVERLRTLPPPTRDDPRIDLAEQAAAGSLADFKRQLDAAEQAARKAQAQGARLVAARALRAEGRALYERGELTKSVEVSQAAKDIYTAAGDKAGAASALINVAAVLTDRGEVSRAKGMYEEAIEILRQVGNKKNMANALNNIGLILKDEGDLSGAGKVHEEVLALRREIGDPNGAAVSLSNLGVVSFEQGNLVRAKRMYQDSLAICRETGDKRGTVRAMLNLAIVLQREGDLGGARKLHDESLAIRREIGDKRGVGVALINLADVLLDQGNLADASAAVQESLAIGREIDAKRTVAYAQFTSGVILELEDRLPEARKAYEESLVLREQLREALTIAECHLRLAEVDIEEGKLAEGEALARTAAEESQRNKQLDDESLARGVLARAYLAQGKRVEARKETMEGLALLAKSKNREARLALSIVEARVAAGSGQFAAAAKTIGSTLDQAAKGGLVAVGLEARLALGEIEMSWGRIPAGRLHLESLEKDAGSRGFALIARKASEALKDH